MLGEYYCRAQYCFVQMEKFEFLGMVAFHGVSYRMALGWSNWRRVILGNI